MADNKKYYYIKLKDHYFDQDNIKILEAQENGYIYSLIIIKMYLKSAKYEGRLMMTETIPYSPEKVDILARVLNHDVSHVRDAIRAASELDLITIIDSSQLWMNEIQNLIGHASSEADRKRKYRKQLETIQNGTNVLESSETNVPEVPKKGQMSTRVRDRVITRDKDREREREKIDKKEFPSFQESNSEEQERNFQNEWETLKAHFKTKGLGDYRMMLMHEPNTLEIANILNLYTLEEMQTAIDNYCDDENAKGFRYGSFKNFIMKGLEKYHPGAYQEKKGNKIITEFEEQEF